MMSDVVLCWLGCQQGADLIYLDDTLAIVDLKLSPMLSKDIRHHHIRHQTSIYTL
jgi:hypothetical protein